MNRRDALRVFGAAMVGTTSRAASQFLQASPYGPLKRAYVAHPQLVRQNCPEWCWAASISMIFSYYRHPINQMRIVQRVWGAPACVTSGNPANIINALSSNWVDDAGRSFTAQVGTLVDVINGVGTLSNATIVNELQNDHPLIYMNTHHCMVLVAMDYVDTRMGPQPQAAGVLDPWPYSPGFRPLTPAEMYLAPTGQATVIATVRVT